MVDTNLACTKTLESAVQASQRGGLLAPVTADNAIGGITTPNKCGDATILIEPGPGSNSLTGGETLQTR